MNTETIQPANSVVETLPAAPAPAQPEGLLAIIARAASDPRIDIDKFERLLAMQEKMEQAGERRAFNEAVAAAKANIAPIVKSSSVDYTHQGRRTAYKYEDFAAVARAVAGPLAEQGISYRFRSQQEGKLLRVTCVLSRGGYSEETTLEVFNDASGGKNDVQAVGSAATYLQRYTLKLALGLAAAVDDDGRGRPPTEAPDPEPEPAPAEGRQEQRETLRELIMEGADSPEEVLALEKRIRAYVRADDMLTMTAPQLDKAIWAMRKHNAEKGERK